jgi:hypothetical protein
MEAVVVRVFGVEDGVGVDEVDEVVVEEVELVELVELVLDVDELDEVCGSDQHPRKLLNSKQGYLTEELEPEEEGGVLEAGKLGSDEAGPVEGVGVGELLGDGVVEVLLAGGSTTSPRTSGIWRTWRGAGALILIMRLRSTWSRR